MTGSRYLVLIAFVLGVTFAAPRLSQVSSWNHVQRAHPDEQIKFLVALHQQNIEKLKKIALTVSDPNSKFYGNHLSKEEILDIVAPPAEVSEKVENFFRTKCATKVENHRDVLEVTAPVSCVENLFGITMGVYQHVKADHAKLIRREPNDLVFMVPEEIAQYVELITGIADFPPTRKTKTQPIDIDLRDVDDFSFNYVIPATARRLYQIPPGTTVKNSKNTQSVIEFYPLGGPLISDMQSFAQNSGEIFTNISHIVGQWYPDAEGESTLDIEYISTLAPNANLYYITITGWIYEMAYQLFTMQDTPLVNSISYGWPESLSCQSTVTNANCAGYTSQTYNARSDNELAKLAAHGISIITCSQDEGAPSEQNIDCSLDNTNPLWPIYPGCSPWVTSVSATTLIDDSSSLSSSQPPICNLGFACDTTGTLEYPCMVNNTYYQWTTGGGFSNYTARPSFQDKFVAAYLSSNAIIPPNVFFNKNNRGYPDISALGSRILIWQSGQVAVTAGTSASTPIFAAMVTLLNDARLNAGKSPLGFIAPLLYDMATKNYNCFHDVTVGNNKCTEGACCKYGYGATTGWDPVTGLGTPNFQEMLKYVNQLP